MNVNFRNFLLHSHEFSLQIYIELAGSYWLFDVNIEISFLFKYCMHMLTILSFVVFIISQAPPEGPTGGLCPAGGYCPEGAKTAQSCPVKTYRKSKGASSAEDCQACDPG